jgi:hypothetical protein
MRRGSYEGAKVGYRKGEARALVVSQRKSAIV